MRIGKFAHKMSKNVFFLLYYHIYTSMLYCLKFSITTCIYIYILAQVHSRGRGISSWLLVRQMFTGGTGATETEGANTEAATRVHPRKT